MDKEIEYHAVRMNVPKTLHAALVALVKLQGRTLTDLFCQLGREELAKHGYKPVISAEDISAEIKRREASEEAAA